MAGSVGGSEGAGSLRVSGGSAWRAAGDARNVTSVQGGRDVWGRAPGSVRLYLPYMAGKVGRCPGWSWGCVAPPCRSRHLRAAFPCNVPSLRRLPAGTPSLRRLPPKTSRPGRLGGGLSLPGSPPRRPGPAVPGPPPPVLPPIQSQLDHAGGDLAGAIASGVAADLEFRRQGIEPALGGALGDVQLGGDLGPRRGPPGEGALAAIRGDQCRGGRPLLLVQRHPRFPRRHRGGDRG